MTKKGFNLNNTIPHSVRLVNPLKTRRTTAPPMRSVWLCDKVKMINPAPLYQMDSESLLETRRTTAPPTQEDLESLAMRDMMTFSHNMLDIIKEIIEQQNPSPKKPLFCFEMTTEATEKKTHGPKKSLIQSQKSNRSTSRITSRIRF
jgi:hypothetical protein